MCPFWKRKKKKYTALKVVAIVFTALAALAGAYVIFEKFFKDKLLKKLGKGCCEDECAGLADEVEDADDTAECQVVEPAAEEVPADEAQSVVSDSHLGPDSVFAGAMPPNDGDTEDG